MKVLFIITSVEAGAWLSEITHPYWHLAERGVEVDFASLRGGKIGWTPWSDPGAKESMEPGDLVSKGFISDRSLMARLEKTSVLGKVDLSGYDAVHVAGGGGAAFDLYPDKDVAHALDYFFSSGKVVGAICHGAVALGNIKESIRGRRVTGFTFKEDMEVERMVGSGFKIPNYTQKVLEAAGAKYSNVDPWMPHVVRDGKLLTGQNQQSASEYGIILYHLLVGKSPVVSA